MSVFSPLLDPKRLRPILGGIRSHLFAERIDDEQGGASSQPRYCYSVWMRHLVLLHRSGLDANPDVVAELGPGATIGTGLAALLTGARTYHGLDAVAFAELVPDLRLFDALVTLLQERTDIPAGAEYPDVQPTLRSYAFPDDVLTLERLRACLRPERIAAIRRAYERLGEPQDGYLVRYVAPWNSPESVAAHSVDLVFSQATMEHVEQVDETYAATARWLKPGGCMSHQVDFRSHGMASDWNGHWGYGDWVYWLAKGSRPYLLNRAAMSEHLRLAGNHGFRVVTTVLTDGGPGIARRHLARRFRHLTDDDLRTSGMYFAAALG